MLFSAPRAGAWLLGGEGVLFTQFLSSTVLFQLKGLVEGLLVDVDLLGFAVRHDHCGDGQLSRHLGWYSLFLRWHWLSEKRSVIIDGTPGAFLAFVPMTTFTTPLKV